jgi:glycosyltransferase involved in cell wall biosynthesis
MFFFERSLLSNVYKLHALGSSEVEDLTVLAPLKKIILIPNGQNIEEVIFKPVKTKEPFEKPIFGFCGRLSKDQKGLDLLIEGFAIYRRGGGKGELWLIGDGPDRSFLKNLAVKKAIEKSIIFLGALFNDEKLSHIAKMDVFVHTSRWDGIPMAVLEAAALSKPLLLSKATNLCPYVDNYENGIVLKGNTPEEIAGAMHQFKRIIDTEKFNDMGQNSFRLVRDELNWHIISKRIFSDLYQ